ncbi:cupin-like domain-containing protein [Phyllosticta paracitricarpa]|uniref:Cupin-like domain-containing protein n=1 Tax=Phyllosticta paracitricarpa TaxID=2016321 RepID=A0ABR1MW69_9PEZI
MASSDRNVSNSVRELINSYHELNAYVVDELYEEPSPLEYMRYVAKNRPFVVRSGAADWDALKKWNADHLKEVMKTQQVNVAITNEGNADSAVETSDGRLIFVEPYEREEPFSQVLDKIADQELRGIEPRVRRYAQTQNDNLRGEYTPLFADVPADIPFARIALEQPTGPDAINFWLGNSYSTTVLHKDNYENIYVQVLGRKHFTLMPPVESACVNEQELPAARYGPRYMNGEKGAEESLPDEQLRDLEVKMAEGSEKVPCPIWDPDAPTKRTSPFSDLAQPLKVTLESGDMLYLPAMWYHKVAQSCSEEGICVAVNYWYVSLQLRQKKAYVWSKC